MDRNGPGFVYILRETDPDLNDRIKIGYSIDPYQRCINLSGTSKAFPFEIYCAWAVSNMSAAESLMHKFMDENRIRKDREHFYIIPSNERDSIFHKFITDYTSEEDVLACCLDSLIDFFNEIFSYTNIQTYLVCNDQLEEYSIQRFRTKDDPNNPKRFAPLFWFEDSDN